MNRPCSALTVVMLGFLIAGVGAVRAADYSWSNSDGGSYTDGSNWTHPDPVSGNNMPGAPSPSDNVSFVLPGPYTVTMTGQSAAETDLGIDADPTFELSGDFNAGSMTSSGATLTVTGGGALTVSGLTLPLDSGNSLFNVQGGATMNIQASVDHLVMNISGGGIYKGAGLTHAQFTVDGAGSNIQNSGVFSGAGLELTNHAQVTNGSTATVTDIGLSGQSSLSTGALTAGSAQDGYSVIEVKGGSTMTSSSAIISSVPGFDDPLGQVTIDGAGSSWTVSGQIQLAVAGGNEGDLTVSNSAHLHAGSLDLGVNKDGNSDRPNEPAFGRFSILSKATVEFDGLVRIGIDGTGYLSADAGTQLTLDGDLELGSTDEGDLYVSGTANISGDIDFGIKNGGTGLLSVSGKSAVVTATSSDLTIGDLGDGKLYVSDGANLSVASADVAVGFDSESIIGVSGAKSKWTITGALGLGTKGDVGMVIDTGGTASCESAELAKSAGFSSLLVSGKGSLLTVSKNLTVGTAGTGGIAGVGLFIAQEGGHVMIGGDTVTVAAGGDAFGLLSVGGAGSVVDASHAQLNVGGSNQGFLEVIAGGTLHTAGAEIGFLADGDAVAVVQGKNSLWTVNGPLVVGVNGVGVVITTGNGKIVSGPITVGPNGTVQGSSTITGAMVNSGTVSPSTPATTGIADPPVTSVSPPNLPEVDESGLPPHGTLNIQGDYTQTATGTLNVTLGASSATDVLAVSGKVTLGGTLNVSLANGFVSDGTQSFTILKGASSTGTFAHVNGADVTYGAHGVTVKPKLVTSPLTVSVSPAAADGTVTTGFLGTTDRFVGVTYTVSATPAPGFLFYHWTGINSADATLSFSMTPNLQLQAVFLPNRFAPVIGSYRGLGVSGGTGAYADGLLTLSLLNSGAFTAKFQLGGQVYSFKGAFDPSGQFTGSTTVSGQLLSLALTMGLDGGNSNKLSGTVGFNGTSYTINAERATFKAPANSAPEAGSYTLIFPANSGQAASPQGTGWATAVVTTSGAVKLAGKLADGTTLSYGGSLASEGTLDVFTSLYSNLGLLAGTLTFAPPPRSTDVSVSDITGTLIWNKPAQSSNKIFPSAFTTTLETTGSFFVKPPANTRLLPGTDAMGDASLTFALPPASSLLSKSIVLSLTNSVTYPNPTGPTDKLALTFTAGTGAFSGHFLDTNNNKATSFGGVILQKQKSGAGAFIDPSGSGAMQLQPQP